MPFQTPASSSHRNRNSSNQNGSGSDVPTVEEIFGTETEEELLSIPEDKVLDPEQLAAREANKPLMADEIAAIEGCITTTAGKRRTRGST